MKRSLLGLFIAAPALLWAQGSQVNTQSQKSVGMAGAGSAFFVDGSSIFYSPGALSKLDGNAVAIGVSGVMYRSAFREENSNDVHRTKFKVTPPFSLFATFGPQDARWKAGLGVYTPFGGSVDWGTEWPGRFELNSLQLRAIYIQPTFSYKVTEKLGVGGGFVYNIGTVDLARSIPLSGPDGKPGQAELSGVGTGMGFNVGLHYDLAERMAVSLSYRSKVLTKLKDGDAEFTVPKAMAGLFPKTTFAAELPLPASINLGISLPAGEKLDIAADATFIAYNVYKELVFDYKDNTAVLTDTRQGKNYKNAFSGKVGLNYAAAENLALRAGVGYVATPAPADYVSPETPDNDRLMASLGISCEISKNFEITGAYVFQRLLERTVTNVESRLSGTYKTNIHVPGISFTYKW